MKLERLIPLLINRYSGLVKISAWGETSLFYNPNGLLKRGTYCITFKEKDGENDSSSALNRADVEFRINFKINNSTFLNRFNEPALPARPAKGKIITLKSGRDYDPTVLDTLIPHPVYGWMGWVSIINPSESSITEILALGLLDESYNTAVASYNKNKSVKAFNAKNKVSKIEGVSLFKQSKYNNEHHTTVESSAFTRERKRKFEELEGFENAEEDNFSPPKKLSKYD